MNEQSPHVIKLQARLYPDRESITVNVTEEHEAYWFGVQVCKRRYPPTVFPKSVWQEVENEEEEVA